MKKLSVFFLVTAIMIGCAFGANAIAADVPTTTADAAAPITNELSIPQQMLAEPPELLTFDVSPDSPHMPWPVVYAETLQVSITCPCVFEYTKETDDITGKPINWQPVTPTTLYQLPDGSWANTVADSSLSINELRQETFYLVEPDCYYRLTANFGSRTQNIQQISPTSEYRVRDIYSGMLQPERTGVIAIEFEELVSDVCITYRGCVNIASQAGINILPQAYATNINGDIIITYYPSPAAEWEDHTSEHPFSMIFPTDEINTAVPTTIRNLLYD